MRDDLLLRDYAEKLGFTYKPKHDLFSVPLIFSKGEYSVWKFSKGWQTARAVAGGYTDFKPFGGLGAALEYVKSIMDDDYRWPTLPLLPTKQEEQQ